MLDHMKGAIFDLDGVIVDTAKYHYLAWKRLAEELGFEFKESDNERLKGVSRMKSLEILLEAGGLNFSDDVKLLLADKKNKWYVEYISNIDESELLKGAKEYLSKLKNSGVRIALGSASKNAPILLDRLKIRALFDSIVDGNKVSRAKPDPEVFLTAARELGLKAEECVVFEDAEAGIAAARAAGMGIVGIGSKDILTRADIVVLGLYALMEQG
ncbi:MAG TPA: beta-phosphoglucomutase [Patescibacteria group bacterium]|nr:beta-phosphoglucomutase [Patescibacteria group bacterium]